MPDGSLEAVDAQVVDHVDLLTGLRRGIRAKELDSLFADEDDPFDWR